MSKNAILDRPREDTVNFFQARETPTADVLHAIEQEIARHTHRTRKLDVIEYQPCPHDRALPLMQGWHLLFFAATGTTQIEDLRTAMLQETDRDAHLIKCVKSIQGQFRHYTAVSSQAWSADLGAQPVIAEIRYGGLTLVPSFWLPEEMEMNLCLLPSIGGRLALDGLTLVEHYQQATSVSLDVLMITVPSPRTKAEQAAPRSLPSEGWDLVQKKHVIPIFTANVDSVPTGHAAGGAQDGYRPSIPVPEEHLIRQHNGRVRDLGSMASVSQLCGVRHQLLVGKTSKTR